MRTLLVVLDGLGDHPINEFDGRTPLEYANTPNLDYMAENGLTGEMIPFKFLFEKHPTSEGTHIGMLGYKDFFMGRGPYEAAGVNVVMDMGDIALRVNFATIDENGTIIDRRAGRIKDTEELVKALEGIEIDGIKFFIKKSTEHRAVLLMRGSNLSPAIISNDPGKDGEKYLDVRPDSVDATFTADVLNKFLLKAHSILKKHPFNQDREFPANYLLVRGAGKMERIYPFEEKYGLKAACVAGGGLYKGIAKLIGMDVVEAEGATGTAETNLENKFSKVKELLNNYNFVFLHIKATDNFSHDKNYLRKKEFIEKVDQYFKDFLNMEDLLVVVTADHCTPCETGEHSDDNVPILLYNNKEKDIIIHFNEKEVKNGQLGTFPSTELMSKILKYYEN